MDHKNNRIQIGTTIASFGALGTIVSMTVFENQTIKIIIVGIGLIMAIVGVRIIEKAKK